MRKLFLLFCACVAGVVSLSAQDRGALEDSVVVGSISRPTVDLVFGLDHMKSDDRLLVQWAYAEHLKEISREPLASFTDQELRGLLEFFSSDAYVCFNSEIFIKTFLENITKALESELGGELRFSYNLRSRNYGLGLKPAYQNTLGSIGSIVEEMLSEESKAIVNAERAGIPAVHIQLMKDCAREVKNNLFNVYRITALDYLSKDAAKAAEDFYRSPLGQKYVAYSQAIAKAADLSSEEFVAEFRAKPGKVKIDNADLRTSVAEYVTVSRAFHQSAPMIQRPIAEFAIGKSRYEGQTRDLVPHGKGKLTDKKGVVYEGYFKDGQRHGMMTVKKPGKEVLTQFWMSDKYRKEVPVGKGKDGGVSAPYVEIGMEYGFGIKEDYEKSATYQGVFTDGFLNGEGKVVEPGRTFEGDFIEGKFVNGIVTWTSDKSQAATFKGWMSGNLGKGIREWNAVDGTRKESQEGVFYNGILEGSGHRLVKGTDETFEATGIFAYGQMYGHGVHKKVEGKESAAARDSSVYEGAFYADRYHGEGRLTMSMNNIPADSVDLSRCSVTLPGLTGKSMDMVMDGVFDNGSFKEGKITYSDGSWFEGEFAEEGLIDGNMLRKYKDGSVYQGECLNGMRHGKGKLRYPDGTVYDGMFAYDEPVQIEEPKKEEDPNAIRYDELTYQFHNLATGFGKATLIQPAGVKIMVRSSKSSLKVVCKGMFIRDNMYEGKVTMSDGNWLEGVFEDGILIEGRGRTIDKYWVVYEGDITNGYPNGNGKCFYSDGTWFEGKFAWGNRMAGTHYTADGKVIKVYK